MKSETTNNNWWASSPPPDEDKKEDVKIELDPEVVSDHLYSPPFEGEVVGFDVLDKPDAGGRGLLESKDERDSNFPLKAGLIKNRFRKSKYHKTGEIMNQRDSQSCVGHAWSLFVSSAPQMFKRPDPYEVYTLAQELDEFEGGEPDYYGTSLRAGAKACRHLGLITSTFRWAYDSDTIWDYIMTRGPVVVGTKWYGGMNTPDEDGFVTIDGEDFGGHAYLICGASIEKKAFLCANSWGPEWGHSGKFWLTMDQFDKLLKEGGVACSAIES